MQEHGGRKHEEKKQEFHLSPLEVDTWKSTYDKEGQLVD